MSGTKNGTFDKLVETLDVVEFQEILRYAIGEEAIVIRMNDFFRPQPAKLVETKRQERELERRTSDLLEKLGGPPRIIVVHDQNQAPPVFDTYGAAAIQEIISSFHRCRRVTCKAHLLYIAVHLILECPEFLSRQQKNVITKADITATTDTIEWNFWEETETAYIRIASFWDRVGQLFDFVFFNIRQYERDVFPTVMNRIQANYIPLYSEFENCEAWKKLRNYQNSKKVSGHPWLRQRRNLLVHSLHLRSTPQLSEESPIFVSAYNHLEESVRNKLKPGTMKDELEYIHLHLQAAADLFTEIIDLCYLSAKLQANKIVT